MSWHTMDQTSPMAEGSAYEPDTGQSRRRSSRPSWPATNTASERQVAPHMLMLAVTVMKAYAGKPSMWMSRSTSMSARSGVTVIRGCVTVVSLTVAVSCLQIGLGHAVGLDDLRPHRRFVGDDLVQVGG